MKDIAIFLLAPTNEGKTKPSERSFKEIGRRRPKPIKDTPATRG